jgi:hypothetical protein
MFGDPLRRVSARSPHASALKEACGTTTAGNSFKNTLALHRWPQMEHCQAPPRNSPETSRGGIWRAAFHTKVEATAAWAVPRSSEGPGAYASSVQPEVTQTRGCRESYCRIDVLGSVLPCGYPSRPPFLPSDSVWKDSHRLPPRGGCTARI